MIPGERFEIDLESDDESHVPTQPVPLPGAFVGDVLERQPATPRLPSAPTLKSKTGFPEHGKRKVESRFKRQKAVSGTPAVSNVAEAEQPYQTTTTSGGDHRSWEDAERQRIDHENRQRIADMSPAEIEEERQELMDSLSPAFLQRLLRRSNIGSGSAEADLTGPPPSSQQDPSLPPHPPDPKTSKSVSFAEQPRLLPVTAVATDEDQEDSRPAEPEVAPTPSTTPLPHDSIHFPQPQQPPDLDPASATFFADLHTKYFPSLPPEPDKLAWMQASQPADDRYSPKSSAFNARDLRFSFTGELIPPKTAALIPVTLGLHHHGDSPDAAGYTVPELAHLARSAYPAQRCIAFQTLGRFLYRLGRGEFGDSGEPGAERADARETFGELARGLWGVVEADQVIETLVRESEGQGVDHGRHVSAKAYATEAVWLWRKGGGRRWKAA